MAFNKVLWVGAVGLAVASGLLAHAFTVEVSAQPRTTAGASDPVMKQHQAAPPACGTVPATLGHVGILKSGVSIADVTRTGTAVRAAIIEGKNVLGSHGDTLVVLDVPPGGVIPPGVVSLLATSGVVHAQSSDPGLLSCNYQLTDSTLAQQYVNTAKTAAVAAGVSTAAELDSDAAIYLVSNDPTRSDRLIVTLDVLGSVVPGPANAPVLHSLRAILVLVSISTGLDTGVGEGTW